MPNQYQFAFIASFVGVFSFLLLVSAFIKTKLAEAGYDISQLILIGLPRDESSYQSPPSSTLNTRVAMLAQLIALLLAVGTSAVIYWKYAGNKRESCYNPCKRVQQLTRMYL